MKIASFNINNIRKRLPNLLDWLREAGPDVVCLQELKATDVPQRRYGKPDMRRYGGTEKLERGRYPCALGSRADLQCLARRSQ
jgi:exonuclease III